jgi:hypothetical protein
MEWNISKTHIITVILFLVLVTINFALGRERILDAHSQSFNGGDCELHRYELKENICDKFYGFDFYYLVCSIFAIAFISGFINVIKNMHLLNSVFLVVISSILYIAVVEFLIQILKIPVLYTGFLESRQYLKYSFIGDVFQSGESEVILFLIVTISIFGFLGNVAGYPILLSKPKKRKS